MNDAREMMDRFRSVCFLEVESELDRGVLPKEMRPAEYKKWKNCVLSRSLTDFPFLSKCVKNRHEYMLSVRNGEQGRERTIEEDLGIQAMGVWGSVLQDILGLRSRGRKCKNNPSLQRVGTFADRYVNLCRMAAEKNFLVPPDPILTVIAGCTAGAFGGKRGIMRGSGWVFNSVEYPGTTWKAFSVIAPPEPEPGESESLLSDNDRAMIRSVIALLEKVGAAEKN